MTPQQPCLLMFDADRIKDFVFATGRLKEIRGGSQIVHDATDSDNLQTIPEFSSAEVIFAEGGSGLLLVDGPDQAQALCRQLQRRYRASTQGASLTAVWEPLEGDFGQAVERAARRLRLGKEGVAAATQHMHSPFTQPCRSCGSRPANQVYVSGDAPTPLCAMCNSKRARADRLRPGGHTRLADVPWGKQFIAALPTEAQGVWQAALLTETLNDLADLSRPGNYLGFLYADGNSLGDLIQQQRLRTDYERLSRRVSFSLQAAVWLTLQYHFPRPQRQVAPFELIALGGDDLIMVTVADQVLPIATTLARLFQRISAQLADREAGQITLDAALAVGRQALPNLEQLDVPDSALTLSCGVVIAHPGQPILNLELRARELLANAKRQYPGQAALDFHIVSSPVLRTLDDIRRDEYRIELVQLTSRPLTIDEASILLKHVRSLKGGGESSVIPRNKLNSLYQSLFAGRDAATFEAFFMLSRLSQEQRGKIEQFFDDFGISVARSTDPAAPVLPWGLRTSNQRQQVFTVFGDLIELYEFVHEASPPASAVTDAPVEESHDATAR